jgi:hypothetical protein
VEKLGLQAGETEWEWEDEEAYPEERGRGTAQARGSTSSTLLSKSGLGGIDVGGVSMR